MGHTNKHGKCCLFSDCERRKFDRRENRQTSCRVISICGYRRGAVAYFIFKVSYDLQSLNKFSAPRFLFLKSNFNRRSGAGATSLNFTTMKKLITLLAAMAIFGSISAQSKTAYLDLYQRGGAQHLRTTLIFNKKPIYLGKKNLGEVLNMLAESGWEIDKTLNVRRVCWFWPFTRHKFHFVLKKEYQAGENPFEQTQTNVIKRLQQNSRVF